MQKIHKSDFPESINHFNLKFQPLARVQQKPSQFLRNWLLDTGSLTQRLTHHFGDFKVQVVFEGWVQDANSKRFFCNALGLARFPVHKLWLRKVNLICNGKVVVRAHTLVPLKTFHNQTKRIGKLQSKSLGQFLFTHPFVERHPITICQTKDAHWGRQSIFFIRKYPLLVTEYFHPDFPQVN